MRVWSRSELASASGTADYAQFMDLNSCKWEIKLNEMWNKIKEKYTPLDPWVVDWSSNLFGQGH